MTTQTIGILGGGKMAEAILSRLVAADASAATRVCVVERNTERHTVLANRYGISVSENAEAIADRDLIILAVKPQDAEVACTALQGKLKSHTLVLSIMEGVPIKKISTWFGGHQIIVRSMPNTPAQVGKGMTGWYAPETISEEQITSIRELLALLGEEIRVASEDEINMVTALSGSGPAYVFAFLEALMGGGKNLGLSEEQATKLAVGTAEGALALYRSQDLSLSELREYVTSKGGTTAAALAKFEKRDLNGTVIEAMRAAYERAQVLEQG